MARDRCVPSSRRDACASAGAVHGERHQSSPGFPCQSGWAAVVLQPFTAWFLIRTMQILTQPRVAIITQSFRSGKTLKITASNHKPNTMSLVPSVKPYNKNVPAIPRWKMSSRLMSNHIQGWKKPSSKAWMKLHQNIPSTVPAFHARSDMALNVFILM